MKPLQITGGHINAPYFIFIDGGTIYGDEEVMALLGIEGFSPSAHLEFPNHFLHITDDGRWLHIADDWLYTQWHSKTIRDRIAKLASKHDIFTCSVGDADYSFDFDFYQGGILVRRYVVEDPNYNGGSVTEDFGEPLPGEAAAFEHADLAMRVLDVARSVGVSIDHRPERTRSFTKPYETRATLPPKPSLIRRLFSRN
jgi:hypothetical protein